MTFKPRNEKEVSPLMSGVVILMMAVSRDSHNEPFWTNNIHTMAKGYKTDSLSSYSHHDTNGCIYSFGNTPFYDNNDGSSVSIYTQKPSNNLLKNTMIQQDSKYLEYISVTALYHGIQKLSTILPEIRLLLSLIINAVFDRQSCAGLKLLESRDVSDNGGWNLFLFVNGRTHQFHREKNCAYTYITVPKQSIDNAQHCTHQPTFLFQINEDQKLSIPMSDDLSFFYNDSFLTHCQSYVPSLGDDNTFFSIYLVIPMTHF